ncbi:MAG: bifunctional phosphoribosyl-AMP cyclohydrolase/phosphoribosyl-ATP diphosphatase HisIE, partial [Eubacterium sp.]
MNTEIKLKYNHHGLIPAVLQDYYTRQVLMVAYMNEESLAKTLETGNATFWSRSRKELWTKGETSGHFQEVVAIDYDCDADTLLIQVLPKGPACHTGNTSCFYRNLYTNTEKLTGNVDILHILANQVQDRKDNPVEGSYTNYLFDKGLDKILKKVGEECTEIVIAAKNKEKEEIKYEISDFLY